MISIWWDLNLEKETKNTMPFFNILFQVKSNESPLETGDTNNMKIKLAITPLRIIKIPNDDPTI